MTNELAQDMRFPLPTVGTDKALPRGAQIGGQLPADSIDPALLSLAMAFVPTQVWEEPYEPALALSRGTIFPSLDKPFIGEEAVPR